MKGVQTLWKRSLAAVKCHRFLQFMICCFSYFLPFSASSWVPVVEKYPQTIFCLLHYFSAPFPSQCRHASVFLQHPPTSSLHPPYPMQLSYNSDISANSPLKDISTMPKIQSPFPCPQESQAQQGGESGQSEATRSLGQILNRNIPYVKIILYSPGEVKNKIQDFLSSHAVRGCSMRTLCLLLQF